MNMALVLAGGTGSRLGSEIPKQYIEVNGKMIIDYCLETFEDAKQIDGIWIVCSKEWRDCLNLPSKFKGFSEPGANRQLSIYNGLVGIRDFLVNQSVASPGDTAVIIHDAARPNLKEETVNTCLEALKDHDGVLPVLPMKDTVYISVDGKSVSKLIDRSTLFAGQAPESFKLGKYLRANEDLLPDKILSINGSTEPAIMAGMDIALIPGDEGNFKITTNVDLERFIDEITDFE